MKKWNLILLIFLLFVTGCGNGSSSKKLEILNVSYDPTREFYQEFNGAFMEYWQEEHGESVIIQQSHAGSGKQARSIIDGLQADIVSLALAYDIDAIAQKGLIHIDWQNRFGDRSSPYTSTIVFLVRENNPLQISDWPDLIKPDVSVITPNPKTSGGARWNYLAAWGYALQKYEGNEQMAKEFIQQLFLHVPVLDSGARGATTTFVERGIGDVLITWENEAYLAMQELGESQFEIIYPSVSILAEPPVTIVDKVVDQRGTREVAEEYVQFLYSEIGQELAAKHFFRPRLSSVWEKYRAQFPEIELFSIELFGGWSNAQQIHFSDGGVFDEIYTNQ